MPSEGDAQLVASIEQKARDNPGNIALRAFDLSYYTSLSDGDQTDFEQCIRSAVENPDSSMGCYACQPSDFERFKPEESGPHTAVLQNHHVHLKQSKTLKVGKNHSVV